MSEIEGPEAVRLFMEYAEKKKCNNVNLLQKLESVTKRHPDTDLTGDTKKDLLPTEEKLAKALFRDSEVSDLLCCPCTLCDRGRGSSELIRNKRILEDSQKRKELAILILSGCFFALADLCLHADFEVNRFAAQPISTLAEHPTDSCFSHIAPIPEQCSHSFSDTQDFSFPDDLCAACRKRAFQNATYEMSSVVNIPILERTTDFTIYDRSAQNLPFIDETPLAVLNARLRQGQQLGTEFYTSKIDPSYCHESLREIKVLFRKVFKYQRHEKAKIAEAMAEATIAMKLARRDKESFVGVLLALTYKDSFHTYVEIVFPYYNHDLSHEFEQRIVDLNHSKSECLLDDALWKASLDIVRAVCSMHDAITEKEIKCSGHFDIKPENIVIQDDNGTMKLFLIDFGQAASHRAGTNYYQPPEVTRPRIGTNSLGSAYDVWSMACLLLEILVFIEFGLPGLRLLRSTVRGNDGNDYSFWQGSSPHDIVLRPAITTRLRTWEDQGDRRMQAAIRQLRTMLSIFPEQRPTMRSCLGVFERINLSRQDLGLPTQDWMNCGLERWRTSYSTSSIARPNPGDLYFFRDKPGEIQSDGERITLDIEFVMKETTLVEGVRFVPHAFFDLSTNPGYTFPCQFERFHERFTFHFSSLDKILEFMSLLTYQRIVPDISESSAAVGTGFNINSCEIKMHGWRNRTRRFNKGTVQIWRQLSQYQYDRYHGRSDVQSTMADKPGSGPESSDGTRSGASTTGTNGIRHPTNAWKLAIWTYDDKTEERTCVVIDIGAKTWRLEDPSGQRAPQTLKIKAHYGHTDFRGAIFAPSSQRQKSKASHGYPGFPISPIELQSSMRSRLTEVTIHFSDRAYHSQILQIFQKNKFNLTR